jgi:hypothetical protein
MASVNLVFTFMLLIITVETRIQKCDRSGSTYGAIGNCDKGLEANFFDVILIYSYFYKL